MPHTLGGQPGSLPDLLESLPESHRTLLFLTTGPHPDWTDQAEVVALADAQIRGQAAAKAGETLLAYVGVHALPLTGTRRSLGWVVTNLRVIIQDDVSVTGRPTPPRVVSFAADASASGVLAEAIRGFDFGFVGRAGPDAATHLRETLAAVLDVVVPEVVATGGLPSRGTASTLRERAEELGLAGKLSWPGENAKLWAKFAKVSGGVAPLCLMADATLLGGAYGLAITADGVTSRDLMESPVSSTWADLGVAPMTVDATKDGLPVGTTRHVIPAHHGAAREALARLVNEVASGSVTLQP